MIDWLIDWLANCLSHCLVDRKTDRIPVGLTGWQCDLLTDLKVERLIHVEKKLTEWLFNRVGYWLFDWFTDNWLIVWLTDELTDWLNCLIDRLTDEWLTDCLID